MDLERTAKLLLEARREGLSIAASAKGVFATSPLWYADRCLELSWHTRDYWYYRGRMARLMRDPLALLLLK